MFLGHYGAALAIKPADRKISLAILFTAVMLSDILHGIFLIAGIEKVAVIPGYTKWIPLKALYTTCSHGLLPLVLWGLLFTGIYGLYGRMKSSDNSWPVKSSLIIFAAVMSHYLCDLLVHVPDLAVLPGSDLRLGLGLWNYPLFSNGLEFLMYGIGMFLYLKSVPKEARTYRIQLYLLTVLLAAVQLSTGLVPPMESQVAMGIVLLTGTALSIILIWWFERKAGLV